MKRLRDNQLIEMTPEEEAAFVADQARLNLGVRFSKILNQIETLRRRKLDALASQSDREATLLAGIDGDKQAIKQAKSLKAQMDSIYAAYSAHRQALQAIMNKKTKVTTKIKALEAYDVHEGW